MGSGNNGKHRLALGFYGLVLIAAGLPLAIGGIWLISLGGSWYYLLAGAGIALAGLLTLRGRISGLWIYLLVFAATLIWALWEVGFAFWPLVPRLVAPVFLAAWGLVLVPLFPKQERLPAKTRPFRLGGLALFAVFIAYFAAMFFPHGIVREPLPTSAGKPTVETVAMAGEWQAYGRTGEATRYAPADQINRENVGKLEQVWVARQGEIAGGSDGKEDQNTPLYADGTLYHCSASSRVTAIDGATGAIKWQFDPKATSPYWKRCRTLGLFNPPIADDCGTRIFVATIDTRLISLKARDGSICESFGNQGVVDLTVGMGEVKPGFLVQTTGATIAKDKIVIGGWVADNYSIGEPSGVIRAFDAMTGQLAWAWDLGNPSTTLLPPEGETYTLGTPNVWAPFAYDETLQTLYLPVGNATPDYYGGQRRPFDDEYNASVVALDVNTGRERWHFRTVHHDIWDYDVPSQPALIDMPDGKGGVTPAVLALTKRGQIFVLDRRTGEPVVEVEEKPVPQGDGTATGEYYSKTQPYSVGLPGLGTDPLTEKRMWGATPIDQMLCRIDFLSRNYKGDFTPGSTKETLFYPGNNGGPNWGSGSFDQARNILVVQDMRMPVSSHLVPRADIDPNGPADPHGAFSPQFGLPFGFNVVNFFSRIGVPCLEPPWGTITGIDLAARKIIWQRPAGTSKDVTFPGLNIKPGLGFYVGMPALGGAMTTGGGLTFAAGTQDYYLRAFDTETGDELWKGRLPTGGQSTPMTYLDKASGRQFVVVTAGGARYNPKDRGDYIVAFALPTSN